MKQPKSEKQNCKKCQKQINNITKITQLISEDMENNLSLERIKSINKTIDLSTRLIMKYYCN